MKTTFKKVALASALMAGTAIVAPQVANAAVATPTAGGTAITVQAPFKTALTPGYGTKARVLLTRDGTGVDSDSMRMYAFLYKSGTYVGYVRSSAPAAAGAVAADQTVTLPTAALDYNQVAFAFLYEDKDTGGAADDTIVGAAANTRIFLITPPAARTAAAGTGVSVVDVSSITGGVYTATAAGATATQADNIAALTLVKAAAVSMTSYVGPTLLTAQSTALLNGADLKLTFDTSLKAIADNSVVPVPQIKVNGPTITTQMVKGAVTAGDKIVRFDDNNGAFNGQLTTVDVKFVADASLANFISDEAGNAPVLATATPIAAFKAPEFAGKAADVIVTGGTAFDINSEMTSLFSTAGKTLANGETIILTLNAAEVFDGTGANNIADVAITGLGTLVPTITGSGAGATAIGVTLTAAGGEVVTVGTDGSLKVGGTALTVALASHAASTKLTTAESKTLDANTAVESVFFGVAPTPSVSTIDTNANGTLDGAQVNFIGELTSPLAATHGVVIEKASDAATKAAVTVSVDAAAPTVLKTIAPEATLESFLVAPATKAANLNTGNVGADLPYKVSVTSSDITYSKIFDASTGALRKVPNVAAATPATDGAKPVVLSATYLNEEGTSPAAGQLKLVASEALTAGTLDSAQLLFAGSSLQLLNLNDGVTALGAADRSLSKTTVTNDTATIGVLGAGAGKVTSTVSNKLLTLNTSTTAGLVDAAANILATDGTKTVTPGTTVYAGPTISQAIGTRSANAVDGNIDTVIVKFSKGMALAATGAKEDGMFKVRGTVGGNYDVSIPAANIDITQAASGYVTLTIPAPGIKGTLTDLRVEYNAGTQATANRLVSTDATPAEITEAGVVFTSANDADTRIAEFPKNSTKLYTMEMKGTLTTDGTVVSPKGTIIRADLVDFSSDLEIKGGNLNVPCNCTGNSNVAVASFTGVASQIENDRKLGKAQTKAFVVVKLSARQDAVAGIDMVTSVPASSASERVFEVTVDTKTGIVTGNGVTGSLSLNDKPALEILDTVYQVTNDGKFRFAIGSDEAPKNAFVLASVKRPDGDMFTAITSPVQSFANHVPFASNVTASGVIGGNLGTVNLSKIYDSSVGSSTGWQLVGFQGEIARTTDAVRKAVPVTLDRLLISVKGNTGEPVTAWTFDNATAPDDEGFLLLNNATSSALQIGSTTIDNVKQVNGGIALALKNPSGGFTSDTSANKSISSADNSTAIDTTVANAFNIFYPNAGNSVDHKADAAKWSLLTMEAAVADVGTWANTNKVGAIIVVGSGNAQKSWFKGATDNTLTTLAKGERAFIFFEVANTAYKFGR